MVNENSPLLVIDGEYGVSNIATIIVYLLSIVKGLVEFVIMRRGGNWVALSFLLNPLGTFKAISLSVTAIYEIIKALPSAAKESLDLSHKELKTLSSLIVLGLQNVTNTQ